MKITPLFVIALTVLSGCQSTSEPVEPIAFSENNSYAYNIANQTLLTRNDSPLRDFTQEEIDEAKAKMVRKSGGDAALFFGSLRILTGDLTGVIDVAGGSMAYLANGNHAASKGRWIITVEKNKFKTKLDAAHYMVNTINTTAIKSLKKYGDVEIVTVEADDRFKQAVINTGEHKGLSLGLLSKRNFDGHEVQEITMKLNGKVKQVYSYGVVKDNRFVYDMLIQAPLSLVYSVEVSDIDYTKFHQDFTRDLPEGFYIYTSSFPSIHYDGKKYTDSRVIVPAIYTQGKKYEFIKPESK